MTIPLMQLRMDFEAMMQLRMDFEAMASGLIPESTKASDDGVPLHLGEQPTTPIAQEMLGATAVE